MLCIATINKYQPFAIHMYSTSIKHSSETIKHSHQRNVMQHEYRWIVFCVSFAFIDRAHMKHFPFITPIPFTLAATKPRQALSALYDSA